jgi:DNA repair protein RadC
MRIKELTAKISHVCDVSVKYSATTKAKNRTKITNTQHAYNILHPWYESTGMYEQREIATVLLMNRQNQVLGILKAGEGNINACIFDMQYSFRAAILASATGLILCHNHPSGNLTPSAADVKVTQEFKLSGKILGIEILDHIILTPDNGYTSLKETNNL